jgi:crotonobetainyl-CoA:carnitine CoA-transferase CaiB-like acyl-CoA transferase
MAQPLEGVRIVDLTALVFGPLATKMLADLGAEVIKIEPPDGELTRHIEPMRSKGMGALFMHINRGKQSVAVDLKDDRGRRIVERLVVGADVFVHSMRQPAIERLGLDYPAVKARNPEIVYCAAWGFDRRGPFADHPAYDDIIQAATGLASLAGDGDGAPRYPRTIIADKVGALFASHAILAAMLHRRATGRGQFVEVPMMECLSWFVLAEHLGGASFEPPTGPPGHPRALADSRRPFATRDSHIAVLPYTTGQWQRFLRHIGRDDLADADWMADIGERGSRVGELYEVVDAAMVHKTTAEWMAVLGELDIPAMPVNDLAGMLEDPQLLASGFFEHYDHPTEGRLMGTNFPVRFSEMSESAPALAPGLGEHTRAVLQGLDFDDDAIEALLADGVVACP